MPKIDVNGIGVAYEIIGEGKRGITITPGGRFSKDTPGVRELARELATAGNKVLIWDRPNTGESDISFDAESESIQNADALAGLLRKIDFGPALFVGGSAGSRVSLMSAIRHPEMATGLFLLWISGGPIGLAVLAGHYQLEPALAAVKGGMKAVAELPAFQEQIKRNPGNRDRILAQDPQTFIKTMQRWADSFFPKSASPVPGTTPEQLAALKIPVVVLRSGTTDLHHTHETSETLAAMIPGAKLLDPPWGDNEWNERGAAAATAGGLFVNWPKLAPMIIEAQTNIQSRDPASAWKPAAAQ